MQPPAAGWYADPFGRHEQRFHDGARWTPYVKDAEVHAVDQPLPGALPAGQPVAAPSTPPPPPPPPPAAGPVEVTGAPPAAAPWPPPPPTGPPVAAALAPPPPPPAPPPPPPAPSVRPTRRSIFGEPVLVVHQRAKLIETVSEYDVLDAAGQQVGLVREIGQSDLRRALRALTEVDHYLTHRVEVCDADGSVVLGVTRRSPVAGRRRRGTVVVNDAMGVEVGRFEQQWRLGKTRFAVQGPGPRLEPLGLLAAEDWLGWDFRVTDVSGREVASVTKSWRGLAVEAFTAADSYVVRIADDVPAALRVLVVAAALAIDLVRKQSGDLSGSVGIGAGLGLGAIASVLD